MSIDKFGNTLFDLRRSSSRHHGIGFTLTDDYDYDVDSKRLVNVGLPIETNDAITVRYAEQKCLVIGDTEINAKKRRISNVEIPLEDSDVVTKNYLQVNILQTRSDLKHFTLDALKGYIKDTNKVIDFPTMGIDIRVKDDMDMQAPVSLKYLNSVINQLEDEITKAKEVATQSAERKCLVIGDTEINAENRRISNVAIPKEDSDVVTMTYLRFNILQTRSDLKNFTLDALKGYIKDTNKVIDFPTMGINIRVKDDTDMQSPVSLNYLNSVINQLEDKIVATKEVANKSAERKCLVIGDTEINAEKRRISNVEDPLEDSDVVTKTYLQVNILQTRSDLEHFTRDALNGYIKDTNKVIDFPAMGIDIRVKDDTDMQSPVSLKYLNSVINQLEDKITATQDQLDTVIPIIIPNAARSATGHSKPITELISDINVEVKHLKTTVGDIKRQLEIQTAKFDKTQSELSSLKTDIVDIKDRLENMGENGGSGFWNEDWPK